MKKVIINCETGEKTYEDLSVQEIEHWTEFDRKNDLARAKREAALTKLAALGLDKEDLKALGL